MTKEELIEMIKSLHIAFNEGMFSTKNENVFPRVLFWDYVWEDQVASGETYEEIETFQISFYSSKPRHEKLIELRNRLREKGLHPQIYHEYVQEDKTFHSYFSIDVIV